MEPDALLPPTPPDMPSGRLLARKEQVMEAFHAHRNGSVRRRRRRLVMFGAAAALLVGGTATTAYAMLKPEPVTRMSGIACFSEASLGSDAAIVELEGRDPIEVCRRLWQEGAMGGSRKAPNLIACVYPGGALAIVPGKDPAECEAIGMRRPEAGYVDSLVAFDRFQQAVLARFRAQPDGCASERVARQIVEEELRNHNLTGWTIEVKQSVAGPGGPEPLRPGCFSPGFRTDTRVVEIRS
jgi:hypothetical protein